MSAPTQPQPQPQGEATANRLLGQLPATQPVFALPPLPAALQKLGEAIDSSPASRSATC
jgi:hypothetical protein